jgi:hypothetical protein
MRETSRTGDIGNGHAIDAMLAEQPSGLAQDGCAVLCHGFSVDPHSFMISIMNTDGKTLSLPAMPGSSNCARPARTQDPP